MGDKTYNKLVGFRFVAMLVISTMTFLSEGRFDIPLDLIVLLLGVWVTAPAIRVLILALEALNLLLGAAAIIAEEFLGGILGLVISGVCLYVMGLPEIKERFQGD